MKVIPVTCLYAGKPELLDKVEEAIRVHQNNDVAVSFGCAAALILERVLLGKNNDDYATFVEQWNIPPAQDAWRKASTYTDLESLFLSLSHELMEGKEDSPFYNFAARSCALPGAFIGPAFLLQQNQKQQNQCLDDASQNVFTTTIRTNILGAGDTCSRAIFLGAVVAAASEDDGDDSSIPEEWIQKMDTATMKRINAAAEAIANLSNATE
jgi:ADP-ribosylglycohydrolase